MACAGLAAGITWVLLLALLGLGIRYHWADVVYNLYQEYNGSYGSIFALALTGMMFIGSACRYLGSGFTLVHVSSNFARPTYMVTVSALLLTSQSTGFLHEHLMINIFLSSMYFRFSGSKPGDRSLISRIISRLAEYMVYMSACRFQLWNALRLVAFLAMVSAGRSHEVLRLSCCDDVSQATSRFNKLDGIIIEKLLLKSPDPERYPQRLREHLEETGIFRHILNATEQFSFLWVDGTGLLYLAGLTVLGLTTVEISVSNYAHSDVPSLVLATLTSTGFMFLVIQCFPALLCRLAEANDWLKANNAEDGHNTLDLLQLEWFHRVNRFLLDLASKGIPEQFETKIQIGSFALDMPWIRRLEGCELIPYVIIFSLVRALGRLLLYCTGYIFKAARLTLLVSRVLDPSIPKLATLALAPVADIWRIMHAIVEAEAALNPANPSNCNSGSCTSTIELSGILPRANDEAGAWALVSELHECARDAIEEAGQVVELRRLLLLLHKFYIVPYQAWRTGVKIVVVKPILQTFCNARYNAYKARGCDCINNEGWLLFKAQLHVALLLHLLVDPLEEASPQVTVLEARALYAWVKARQSSKLVILFLADVNPSI